MNAIKDWRQEQQCLLCKKRRVRCDYSKPSCKRCGKDGVECPGYVRIRKWQGSGPRQGAKVDEGETRRMERLEAGPSTKGAIQSIQGSQDVRQLGLTQILLDEEETLLFECWDHFNNHMVPTVWPAQRPFHRATFQLPNWQTLPPIIQQLLILHVRTSQSARAGTDPSANNQICRYRGRCLTGLNAMILSQRAVSGANGRFDPEGLVLISVIIFVLTDLQAPPSGSSIDYHLNATRRIIALRGGFSHCWEDLSASRGMLLSYMVNDLFRATTRDAQSIDTLALEQQLSYVDFMVLKDDEIKQTAYVCPHSILQAIIKTTILRVALKSDRLYMAGDMSNYACILKSLEEFDPSWWAVNVTSYGHMHPQKAKDCASRETIAGWTALGICFKCAALLYLRLSCPQPDGQESGSVQCAKQTLSSYVHYLLQIGTGDPDGPAETHLWKFLGWPVTMSVYARVACKVGEDSAADELEYARRSARIMGVRSFCGFFDDFGLFEEVERIERQRRLG